MEINEFFSIRYDFGKDEEDTCVNSSGMNEKLDISHNFWLTHFMPLISLDIPSKQQKTSGFLMFAGGIKRDQWHETGYV